MCVYHAGREAGDFFPGTETLAMMVMLGLAGAGYCKLQPPVMATLEQEQTLEVVLTDIGGGWW